MLRKLLKLLFVVVTIKAFSLQSANHKNVENESDTIVYRLSTNVVPMHYDLKLESEIVTPDSNCVGVLDVRIEVRESTNSIELNWKNVIINETQSYLKNENNGESYSPKEHLYDLHREMLILVFDDNIELAVYNLHLEFSSEFSSDLRGFYRNSYINEDGNKTWLAVTHFQPISARRTFPCWDEPAFKATFNVSIKHYANFTALSNMPAYERSFTDENEDKVWTRFERTPIMATNILAFAITDFEHISLPDNNVTIWARKSVIPYVRFSLKVIPKIENELKKYMTSDVIVPKIDHIAVPDYSSGATENWGLIAYKEKLLIYKKNETTIDEMDRTVMLIAHELTHQWFGNLVGPRWWQYMWMSEGFAAYFQYYIMDKVFNEKRTMDKFVVDVMEIAFQIDNCHYQHPMSIIVESPTDIPAIYSFITYRKGAVVLRMLSHCITDEIFRAGLIKYIYENKYKTATPDDLWRSLQVVLDQSNLKHQNFDIKSMMDTWTEQEGYPRIFVQRNYDTGTIQVRQFDETSKKLFNKTCDNKWWIPLNFVSQSNPDFSSTLPTHWLSPSENTKTIEGFPKDGWIIVNVQQTGYYRVYYDEENWKRIARYLNSNDYNNIHVLNRIQIIDDALNSWKEKNISTSTFAMVINYIWNEDDPLVWRLVFRIFFENNHWKDNLVIFKPYVRRLLNNKLKDFDYKDNPDDDPWTIRMKQIVKQIACSVDVPECLENATAQLVDCLENPESTTIKPDSRNWLFCYGLQNANESVWNDVLNIYVKNRNKVFLTYLSCSYNRTILENYLTITFSDDSPISKNDIHNVLEQMTITSKIGMDTFIDFVSQHLNEPFSKTETMNEILRFVSYRITTREQLKKMIEIFSSKGAPLNGMILHFEMTQNEIEKSVSLALNLVNATTIN